MRVRRKKKPIEKKKVLSAKATKLLETARSAAEGFDNKLFGEMYIHAIEEKVYHDNDVFLDFIKQLDQPPVGIEEFIDSPDFVGTTDLVLWPEVREAVIDLNKYWWRGVGPGNNRAYIEALLMGCTRSGKTEISKLSMAYYTHILGCLKKPQILYKLPTETPLVMVIQGAKPHVTKKVVYEPLRKMIEAMPWFKKHMRPNKYLEKEMYFDKVNLAIVQGTSDSDAVLGQNVIMAIIDEVNFMKVVKKSRKADISTGREGSYDQAQVTYDTVSRRRKNTFMYRGPNIGMIIPASSTRYKGDFTDRRKKQVIDENEQNVFIYDHAQYEVRPPEFFSEKRFWVLVANDAASDIEIVEDPQPGQRIPPGSTCYEVPVDYVDEFKKDPAGAMRDVIGKSVSSINPFFRRRGVILDAVQRGTEKGLVSILYKDNVILGPEGMPQVKRGHYCTNPTLPRYVHIDLSENGDSCGIGMVRYDGMVTMHRATGATERLPAATVELAVSIEPDHTTEIDIAEVRTWVRQLKEHYGYPIKSVTYDGWNSLESRQAWAKVGMPSGQVSVDRFPAPYKQFRDAMADGRVDLYEQQLLVDELYDLEYNEEADKIDHPINGSKDCADGVCGAYEALMKRSSTWADDEIPEGEDPGLYGRVVFDDRDESPRPM